MQAPIFLLVWTYIHELEGATQTTGRFLRKFYLEKGEEVGGRGACSTLTLHANM